MASKQKRKKQKYNMCNFITRELQIKYKNYKKQWYKFFNLQIHQKNRILSHESQTKNYLAAKQCYRWTSAKTRYRSFR